MYYWCALARAQGGKTNIYSSAIAARPPPSTCSISRGEDIKRASSGYFGTILQSNIRVRTASGLYENRHSLELFTTYVVHQVGNMALHPACGWAGIPAHTTNNSFLPDVGSRVQTTRKIRSYTRVTDLRHTHTTRNIAVFATCPSVFLSFLRLHQAGERALVCARMHLRNGWLMGFQNYTTRQPLHRKQSVVSLHTAGQHLTANNFPPFLYVSEDLSVAPPFFILMCTSDESSVR